MKTLAPLNWLEVSYVISTAKETSMRYIKSAMYLFLVNFPGYLSLTRRNLQTVQEANFG